MMLLKKYLVAAILMCVCLTLRAQTDAVLVRQCDSLNAIIDRTTDAATLASLYNQLAYKQLALSNNTKMIGAAEKSAAFANQAGLKDLVYDSHLLMARTYRNDDAPEEALHHYIAAQSALDRKTTEGSIADADIDTEIGQLFFNRGHYKRAAVDYGDALQVYKEQNLPDKIKQNTSSIAICNYQAGDYAKAAEYYQQLLDLHKKDNDRAAEKQTLRRLADIHQKLK